MAPALENPPWAEMRGWVVVVLAGWFGCTRE
jgi:hypothetical protein